jgi:hypothetical protein
MVDHAYKVQVGACLSNFLLTIINLSCVEIFSVYFHGNINVVWGKLQIVCLYYQYVAGQNYFHG